jgi:hypothetical protein
VMTLSESDRVGVEEMFCTFKQMVCRGTLGENLCLTDVKSESWNFPNMRPQRCRVTRQNIINSGESPCSPPVLHRT